MEKENNCRVCDKELEKKLKCGSCKQVVYCSRECQKTDWPKHKQECKKQRTDQDAQSTNTSTKPNTLTIREQEALIEVIKSQFIDIAKIISFVDPEKAAEFRKRNAAAQAEHSHDHDHDHDHDHGHSCSHSPQNKYYIKQSDMNSVDKVINGILTSPNFFKNNLKQILEQCEKARTTMMARAKQLGMIPPDSDTDNKWEKEFIAKIFLETVNRFIFTVVHKELKEQDQTYSKQPGLIAHPNTVAGMKDCNLKQISAENFGTFVRNGYIALNDFLAGNVYDQVCKPLIKLLDLLEKEGKFEVRRPKNEMTPVQRTDKFFNYSLNVLEDNEELKDLRQLSRFIFFLPFEINSKLPLSLQASEQFQLHYFDEQHPNVNRRADSMFGTQDTGVKLGIFYCLNTDAQNGNGQFKLALQGKSEEIPITLRPNTLIMFNSRAFSYEIKQSNKCFMVSCLVPGPPSPPSRSDPSPQPYQNASFV